jgi:hypothetical protein
VLAAQPYPLAHANLQVVVGALGDLGADDAYDAVVLAPGEQEIAAARERLAAGGLLVAGVPAGALDPLDGLELLDRAGVHRNGNGGWALGERETPELLLVTARRP